MKTFVLNGWAASPAAWDLCAFARDRVWSYVEQLDGLPARALAASDGAVLVGWSMGGAGALKLALEQPGKIRGLVLVAATARMMEAKDEGWAGMSPRRLKALELGLKATHGEGFFGVPEGKPNPYATDTDENLRRGLDFLRETDLRAALLDVFSPAAPRRAVFPVYVFQSVRDGIVRPGNADFLRRVFPQAVVETVPGGEHALPIWIPEKIDAAVAACRAEGAGTRSLCSNIRQ